MAKKNLSKQKKMDTRVNFTPSHTITLYLGADDQIWYVAGLPNYEDPSCVKKTTYGAKGVRDVLLNHTTEEGVNPVAKIMLAKKELDAQKSAYNSKMTDAQYDEQLSRIKKGELPNGEKVPTMTVIIRPLDTATYENMIAALDEMLICSIDKYVIDKIGPDDRELIEKAGVK